MLGNFKLPRSTVNKMPVYTPGNDQKSNFSALAKSFIRLQQKWN